MEFPRQKSHPTKGGWLSHEATLLIPPNMADRVSQLSCLFLLLVPDTYVDPSAYFHGRNFFSVPCKQRRGYAPIVGRETKFPTQPTQLTRLDSYPENAMPPASDGEIDGARGEELRLHLSQSSPELPRPLLLGHVGQFARDLRQRVFIQGK